MQVENRSWGVRGASPCSVVFSVWATPANSQRQLSLQENRVDPMVNHDQMLLRLQFFLLDEEKRGL